MKLSTMPQCIIKIMIVLVVGAFFMSCGTTKKGFEANTDDFLQKSTATLLAHLDSLYQHQPDFYYAKFKSGYSDTNNSFSFRTSIRMKKDSAIQTLIKFSVIPLFNVVVSTDSLLLLDSRNNCYIKEDINHFKQLFNLDFTYKNIEEIILGLPVLWNKEAKYQREDTASWFVLSNKPNYVQTLSPENRQLTVAYYLNKSTLILEKVVVTSEQDHVVATLHYSDFRKNEGFTLPYEISAEISTPKNTIDAQFQATDVLINKPRTIYLVIPDKYEQCK